MYRRTTGKRSRPYTATTRSYKKSRYNNRRYRSTSNGYTRTAGFYGRYVRSRSNPNPELKYFDTSVAATTINNIGEVPMASICLVPEGTAMNAMIGRYITIKSIQGIIQTGRNWETNSLGSEVEYNDIIRISIVWDKQCNGSAPTWSNVYETQDITAPRNMEYSKRFTILKSWIIPSTANTMVYWNPKTTPDPPNPTAWWARASDRKLLPFYLKTNIKVEYGEMAGATRNLNELKNNNISILAISENGSIYYGGYIRIRYSDN